METKRSGILLLSLFCGYSLMSATVVKDDGKLTIDVPQAEDYTLSADDALKLKDGLDLYKTGVGRLIISTDLKSESWDGEIVVEAGYLRTTLNGALGGVAKGTVIKEGATLEIEDNSLSYAKIHTGEHFAIGGEGVGKCGAVYAIKGKNPDSGKSISTNMMFGDSIVTLTSDTIVGYAGDDASINGSCGFRGATVDMGGYTLTFKKGANHGFFGGEIKNPGRINVEAGIKLTLENEINLGDHPDKTLYLGKNATLVVQNLGKDADNLKKPGWRIETEAEATLKMQGDVNCSWYGPIHLGGALSFTGRMKEYFFRGAISGPGSIAVSSPDDNPALPVCIFDNKTATPNSYEGAFTLSKGSISFTGLSGIPSLAEGGFSASRGTSVSMQAVESDTISDEKLFGIWKTVSLNAPQPPSNPLSSSDYDHKRADFKFELGLGRDYSFAKNIDENITVYHGGENETLTIASQIGALPNFVNSAGTLKFAGAGTQRASWIDLRGGTVEVAAGTELNLSSNAYVCAPFPGVARLKIAGRYSNADAKGATRLARNLAIAAKCGRGVMEIEEGAEVEERFASSGSAANTCAPNGWGDDEKFNYAHPKSMASYYQRGGIYRTTTGNENYLGNYFGFYYSLEGGLLHFRSTSRMAYCSAATATIHQRAGICYIDNCSFDSTGVGRFAHHYISGGTLAMTNGEYALVRQDSEGRSLSFNQGYGALAVLTVEGENSLCDMHIIDEHLSWRSSLNLAAQHYSRGQVNLLSGGVLRANGIYKKINAQVNTVSGKAVNEDMVGNVADVAFDGGVMQLTCRNKNATQKIFRNFIGEDDHVRVYGGGAAIDTNGKNWTLGAPLEAPEGNGVEAIALPDGIANAAAWEFTASPTVEITDPTGVGTGATAVAVFDTVNGKVTGIKITNRGNNYASALATISRGGHTNSWTVAATVSPNVSGGFEKRGAGTLIVDKVCTYTGPTKVSGGVLKLDADGAIDSSSCVVLAGGTLDVNAKAFDVPVAGGAGSVVGTDALTLSASIGFDARQLVAGGALSFEGPITVPAGAVVDIDNLEELEQTKKGRFRLISATGGYRGKLPELSAELTEKGWWLELSADGKHLYVYRSSGLWLICR
jgi:autotransporter-associated beta strand protein